jgi:hypothetical protein
MIGSARIFPIEQNHRATKCRFFKKLAKVFSTTVVKKLVSEINRRTNGAAESPQGK